jgi:hypothetical protein
VNAVRAPSIFDELQGACGLPSMKSTEKVAETCRTEPARKTHRCPRLSRRRGRLGQFPTDRGAGESHESCVGGIRNSDHNRDSRRAASAADSSRLGKNAHGLSRLTRLARLLGRTSRSYRALPSRRPRVGDARAACGHGDSR